MKFENKMNPVLAADGAEDLLTLDDAVQLLGTSRPTLYRWLAQGEIKGLKVGKQWRFRKSDLVSYLERDPLAVAAAPEEVVEREIAFLDAELEKLRSPVSAVDESEAEPGMDRLIRRIFQFAVASLASDIHLDPIRLEDRSGYMLRVRIDGKLQGVRCFPSILHEVMNLHFKQMANMDLTERKMPQDGGIPFTFRNKQYVFGVAALPTVYGEALTVRIVLKDQMMMKLDQIGISAEHPLRSWIKKSNGVILVAGPSGSGKTTTLYSCLCEIATPDRKTLVISDPVDVVIPNTTTVQVNERAGMSVGAALRAAWQHDPDVLCVSGLPDGDAARAIPEFALNGHLVLVQMAASSAVDAVQRLIAIGVDPVAAGMSLIGVIAQRLARKLCTNCKQEIDTDSDHPLLARIRQRAADGGYIMPSDTRLFIGRGCDQCRNTGYRGRVPLYEAMPWSPALMAAVMRHANADELTDIAVSEGMRTLIADGISRVVEGQTTLDEVFRVSLSGA